MKRLAQIWILTLALGLSCRSDTLAQAVDIVDQGERRAQTGMKFLSLSVDARAAALGDAVTAEQHGSSVSLFYNPATLAFFDGRTHASAGQVQWIGEIDYNYGSIAFRPADGTYGTMGVSVVVADYGEFEETIRTNTDRGYEVLGTYSPTALALGIGYARALTDRFAVGGNVKYAKQSLGESTMLLDESGSPMREDNEATSLVYDFGVIYRTGFRGLNIAMSVRNFAQELTFQEENVELPLTFRVGTSITLNEMAGITSNTHRFMATVDAERPRDFSEQVKIGGEYVFMDVLALRAGYAYPNDEQSYSLGAGLNYGIQDIRLGIDYAYTEFGMFGNVNRIAVNFSF